MQRKFSFSLLSRDKIQQKAKFFRNYSLKYMRFTLFEMPVSSS